MFDFHLHLARLPQSESVGERLLEAGCGFNNVACEPWEWEKSLKMLESAAFAGVDRQNFAFGIHPMVAAQVTDNDWRRLEEILRSENFSVGECGLDKRFAGYEPAGVQERLYKKQVRLAQELNRPLQVHCVGDYFRALKITLSAPLPQVIFHRFGGDTAFVKTALKHLGDRVIFSLHADSFHKKSTAAAIGLIPPAQIRFETDADESFIEADAILQKLSATIQSYQKP